MSDTGIYQGRVHLHGMPFHEDGEVLNKVQISVLGTSAKLGQWSKERQLFMEIDYMDDFKISQGRGEDVVFTGSSRQLRDDVKTDDREVRWELTPEGCKDCR